MRALLTIFAVVVTLGTVWFIFKPEEQNQGIYLMVASNGDTVNNQLTEMGLLNAASPSRWEVVYADGEHVSASIQDEKYSWWHGTLPNKQMRFQVVSNDPVLIGGTDAGIGTITFERSFNRFFDIYWPLFFIYFVAWAVLMIVIGRRKHAAH